MITIFVEAGFGYGEAAEGIACVAIEGPLHGTAVCICYWQRMKIRTCTIYNVKSGKVNILSYVSHMHTKAFPIQAWSGPYGSRRLSLPEFDNRGMKVALRTGRFYPLGNIPGTHFC